MSNASAPLLHINQQIGDPVSGFMLTAGGRIAYYFNPFQADGGTKIPIEDASEPAGRHDHRLRRAAAAWYQSNEVPNVAEVITRRDYYRMDWPVVTRQREYGVYAEEVLAVYAPFGHGRHHQHRQRLISSQGDAIKVSASEIGGVIFA